MRPKSIVAGVATALLLTIPAAAQTPVNVSAVPRGSPSTTGSVLQVPGVGEILDRRQELGLSTSQVEHLERVSVDVVRDAIRRQADLMIAQVDLSVLLGADPGQTVDVVKAEAKLREIERIRADLQLALVRAVETAKAELTPEQRTKLATSVDIAPAIDPPPTESGVPGRPTPRGQSTPVIQVRGTAHAPPGGGVGRPHVPPPHPGPAVSQAPAPRFRPHFDRGPHVRVFAGPLWWDPYWIYSPPPVIVPEPPVYSVPPSQTYWYYCPSLGAYYPYVPSCPDPWLPIPAS